MKYNRIRQFLLGGGLGLVSLVCVGGVLTHWEESFGFQGLGMALLPGALGAVVVAGLQVAIRRDNRLAAQRAREIGAVALSLFDAPAKVGFGDEGLAAVAVGLANGTKLRVAIERWYSEVAVDVQGITKLDAAVMTTPERKQIKLTKRGLILRGPPSLEDAKARRDLLLEVREELQQLATRKAVPGNSGYR